MKKILIIEDDTWVQKMYVKFLEDNFQNLLIHVCAALNDAKKAIKDFNGFDMYILDGTVLGGHTYSMVDTLPKEKVIVISGEEGYVNECNAKSIKAYMKPFTWIRLKENKIIFETILNQ